MRDFNQNRLAVPGDFENVEEKEGQVPVFGFRQLISEGPSRRLSVSRIVAQHRKTRLIGDNKVFTVHLWPQNM